jgi:hypothetical protein
MEFHCSKACYLKSDCNKFIPSMKRFIREIKCNILIFFKRIYPSKIQYQIFDCSSNFEKNHNTTLCKKCVNKCACLDIKLGRDKNMNKSAEFNLYERGKLRHSYSRRLWNK